MDSGRNSATNFTEALNQIINSLEYSGFDEENNFDSAYVSIFREETVALWNNPAFGALITGLNGKIHRVNNTFLNFTGYDEEEISGSKWSDLCLTVEKEEAENNVEKLIHKENSYVHFRLSVLTKSAKAIPTDYYVTAIFNGNEKPEEFLHIVIPHENYFSAEPIVKFQKDFLHTLLNSIPNAVYYKNNKGIFLGCNKKFEELFDEKADEIFGKSEYEIFPEDIAAKDYNTDLEIVRSPQNILFSATYFKPDGRKMELEINKSAFFDKDGKLAGIIGIINDVTRRKEFEINLLESQEKLKKSNKNKDKLFSVISHNLRSPFTTILGFSDILVDEFDNYSDEDKKSFASEIRKSAQFAYSLLNNLLLWTKIQLGNLKPVEEFLDLTIFIDEVIHNIKRKADKKSIVLENRIPEHFNVFADKTMLGNIMENILDNAIKFSYEKSRVVISASKSEQYVQLEIKDSGTGINAGDIPKLLNFEEHITSYGTGNEKGTGLGLIICNELLKIMNGELLIESQKDIGTTVIVKLPKSAHVDKGE